MPAAHVGLTLRTPVTVVGVVQVCLFGATETNLRDALRGGADDDELAALVRAALRRKLPQHAGEWLGNCLDLTL